MSINKMDCLIYGHCLNNALQRKIYVAIKFSEFKTSHTFPIFILIMKYQMFLETLLKDKSNFLVVEITQLLLLYILYKLYTTISPVCIMYSYIEHGCQHSHVLICMNIKIHLYLHNILLLSKYACILIFI